MNRKSWIFGGLLVGIAIVGPAVAFAGVNVIYPQSSHTVNVISTPPITFGSGADYATAATQGFAGSFATADNGASASLTLSGLSGGTITVDKYLAITKASTVSSFKMQVGSALSGTLTTPTLLKIRLWTGATAPTADGSAGVCAVLDLQGAADAESSAACSGASTFVQIVYQLPSSSSGSSSVSVRPSSIVFA